MLKHCYIKVLSVLYICCCISFSSKAQHQISKFDLQWAVLHPFSSIKIKKELKVAMKIYQEVKTAKTLDTLEYGGKLDAFRHVFTMALLTKNINTKKLRKLGIAHEKGNKRLFYKNKLEFGERADSLSCEMDLLNNELGFEIGKNHKKLSINELKLEVINQIISGKAFYLKRNSENSYVNCNNEPINLKFYIGKWSIPKCLVRSNF